MDYSAIYQRAAQGDFRDVPAALTGLAGHGTPGLLAWSLAFRAQLRLVAPQLTPPIALSELAPFLDGPVEVRDVVATACADLALGHAVAWDVDSLARLAEFQGRLRREGEVPLTLCHEHSRVWLDLHAGRFDRAEDGATALASAAASAQLPALVALGTAQQALASLALGKLEEATTVARRASRMARTEGLLQQEYLANLVLARVRRYVGMPHLSARILGSLVRVIPSPWRAWVAWELLFSGAHAEAREQLNGLQEATPAAQATRAAEQVLSSASMGERATFESALEALSSITGRVEIFRRETAVLSAALDARHHEMGADESFDRWMAGDEHGSPSVLSGLCIPDIDDTGEEVAGAFVVCGDGSPTRRVLRFALGLIDPTAARGHTLAHARANSGLAILAYAGPDGLGDAKFFQSLYGFAYEPAKHGSALRQVVRRMREEIGPRASVDRVGDRYALIPSGPCAIPDPRCAPELDELILRYLASRDGRAAARDMAAALGVALRTVQLALKRLVDDGACLAIREGRAIDYKLEDTTFAEPSLTRLAPKGA